jgi:mRNA interferase RelE/StbE
MMVFVNHLRGYSLVLSEQAKKDLQHLEHQYRNLIEKKLRQLVSGYQNVDVKKLTEYSCPTYRLRTGTYRVVFLVQDRELVVLIIGIDHRKDAYK